LQKLANLPEQLKVYCGHEYTLANLAFAQAVEPQNEKISLKITQTQQALKERHCSLPSELSAELSFNPFLRCGVPAIRSAVEKKSGCSLTNPIEIFHQLREWKNHF